MASATNAAARGIDATAKGKDSLKRDKYSRTGMDACRFVPLSHETFGHAGPVAFDLLNEIAEFPAGSGVVSKTVVTKELKGEATQRRNESACSHTNPMQPASHRGSHTRPDSAHNQHSH